MKITIFFISWELLGVIWFILSIIAVIIGESVSSFASSIALLLFWISSYASIILASIMACVHLDGAGKILKVILIPILFVIELYQFVVFSFDMFIFLYNIATTFPTLSNDGLLAVFGLFGVALALMLSLIFGVVFIAMYMGSTALLCDEPITAVKMIMGILLKILSIALLMLVWFFFMQDSRGEVLEYVDKSPPLIEEFIRMFLVAPVNHFIR